MWNVKGTAVPIITGAAEKIRKRTLPNTVPHSPGKGTQLETTY